MMIKESSRSIAVKLRQVVDIDGCRLLEVGCGEGAVTQYLAASSVELIALDPDPANLKRAGQKLPRVDFRLGSGEALPFPDATFDVVLFTKSLHHHQDCDRALREAARVVKAAGRVVVVEPVNSGELEQLLNLLDDETEVLLKAQQAVRDCRLKAVSSEVFFSRWVFADKDDLLQSLFAYYQRPFDRKIAARILALLSAKCKDRPLALRDSLVIQVLKRSFAPPLREGATEDDQ